MESTVPTESVPLSLPETAPTEVRAAVAGASDRCVGCGAPLAVDQRYCTECGERLTGRARSAPAAAGAAPETVVRRSTPRMSSSATLIAGIGTLLLALGVGVLIGRSGEKSSSTRANAPVQVVTVAGGGAAPAAAATAGAKTAAAKANKAKSGAAKVSAGQKAALGGGKPPPKAVVKIGQKGHGPGYQKGKFTGNFFGP